MDAETKDYLDFIGKCRKAGHMKYDLISFEAGYSAGDKEASERIISYVDTYDPQMAEWIRKQESAE